MTRISSLSLQTHLEMRSARHRFVGLTTPTLTASIRKKRPSSSTSSPRSIGSSIMQFQRWRQFTIQSGQLIVMVDNDELESTKKRTRDGPEFKSREGYAPVSGKKKRVNKVKPAKEFKTEEIKVEKEAVASEQVPKYIQEPLTNEQLARKWDQISISAYRIIQNDNDGKQEADGITEFTSPTDVYPIRIELNKRQLLKMKIIRFFVFICCFYFIVPFDLYIHQHYRRIWLFETDFYQETVSFAEYDYSTPASDYNFTFQLTNCKVYLEERAQQGGSNSPPLAIEGTEANAITSMKLDLEFGFPWGTDFEFDGSRLRIDSGANEMCSVKLFMNTKDIIPKLIFNMTGAQDNIMFQDNTNKYTSLQLLGGLEIFGEKAFITLADHTISNLSVSLQYGIVILEDIVCPTRFINLTEGIYNDVLPSNTEEFTIQADQPEGNICLRGPLTQSLSNGTCEVIEKGYNDTSYQVSGMYSCSVGAKVCKSEGACSGDNETNSIKAYVRDGQIQISIREERESLEYTKIAKNFAQSVNLTLNSYKKLNDSTKGYFAEPDISSISKFQLIGASYRKTWLYTNKKVYFQAQYWPLIWASAGLLTPKMLSNKLLLIDNTCPTRTPQLTIDAQVSALIESMHPLSISADTAFSLGQSDFYRVQINSYGEAEYSQIKIGENPLLIGAFALSSVIALLLTGVALGAVS
ncbi:hypothetical protein FGO68_gene14499 [Halteria grandinella]|uniref:Uncharacterized protein n=1 Tax=Halteria grandinella TaxID=5974 RepID=A0A8J8P977_HALGN|nr:hypothetical protein FGO68_gene14499 [Halteria grandinella]